MKSRKSTRVLFNAYRRGTVNRLEFSAAEFARRLGVTSASVWHWEAQRGRVTLQTRTQSAPELLHQQG